MRARAREREGSIQHIVLEKRIEKKNALTERQGKWNGQTRARLIGTARALKLFFRLSYNGYNDALVFML